jgi:hypothetical protein
MTSHAARILRWSPRVLALTFGAFITLFALDAFSESNGFVEMLVGFIIHLLPTFLVLGIVMISWKREWIGAILFTVLAILYVASVWERYQLRWWSSYLLIGGPMLVVAVLYGVNWILRDQIRGSLGRKGEE